MKKDWSKEEAENTSFFGDTAVGWGVYCEALISITNKMMKLFQFDNQAYLQSKPSIIQLSKA